MQKTKTKDIFFMIVFVLMMIYRGLQFCLSCFVHRFYIHTSKCIPTPYNFVGIAPYISANIRIVHMWAAYCHRCQHCEESNWNYVFSHFLIVFEVFKSCVSLFIIAIA